MDNVLATPTTSNINQDNILQECTATSPSDKPHSSIIPLTVTPYKQSETSTSTTLKSIYPPIEVLDYQPSLPEARGVVSVSAKSYDDPASKPNQMVDMFKEYRESYNRSPSPVQQHSTASNSAMTFVPLPVILSAPLPHDCSSSNCSSGSSSNKDLDITDLGDGSSKRTVIIDFQVLVPKERVGENGEVRITGNLASLGKWDVFQSVPLSKTHEDLWSKEIDVSYDLPIEFRYLIVECVKGKSGNMQNPSTNGTVINIMSWETFIDPRRCSFEIPKSSNRNVIHTQIEEYGVLENGGQLVIDDGWLVDVSELHLQLGTCGRSISIPTLSEDTMKLYFVKVQPFSSIEEVIHSHVKVKVLNRTIGDCLEMDQGEHGCPFDEDDNILVFYTQSPDFKNCGFIIDIYKQEEHDKSTSFYDGLYRVGRACLQPQQYMIKPDITQGKVVLTVFSQDLLPIGSICLTYLLINPVKDSLIHMTKHTYLNYWKRHKRMLHIGHRGLGDSYHLKGELKPTVTENTISSLKLAGEHGADYVEFDVQLTKDHIPIVYHDFEVCTTLAREGYFSGELYKMSVKDLTLHQLQSLKLDHSSILEKNLRPGSGNISSASDSESHNSANETYWGTKGGASSREHLPERRTFPTLQQLFQKLPDYIGFCIEVKFPVPEKDEHQNVFFDEYFCDYNVMADAILKVVYRHANGRKVVFSCFNPDFCTVLRHKQAKYPVLFLTSDMNPIYNIPIDVRAHSLYDAMMHARAEKLVGICCNSTGLLSKLHLVECVKMKQLVLFTWGYDNNDVKNTEIQKQAGIDAVIYDGINILLPGPQKNIFQLEGEEAAHTKMQARQKSKRGFS